MSKSSYYQKVQDHDGFNNSLLSESYMHTFPLFFYFDEEDAVGKCGSGCELGNMEIYVSSDVSPSTRAQYRPGQTDTTSATKAEL